MNRFVPVIALTVSALVASPALADRAPNGAERAAIEKMLRAIEEFQITGIETTLPFGTFVLNHEAFISGNFDTKFIDRYFTPEMLATKESNQEKEIAAALAAMFMDKKKPAAATSETVTSTHTSNWKTNRLN